jgi:hypothetical protein
LHNLIFFDIVICRKITEGLFEKTMLIKPGNALIVVIGSPQDMEVKDMRKSMVLDILDKHIIIAQTDPPLMKDQAKRGVILSALTRQEGCPARYGFSAKLLEVIDHYPLAYNRNVPALRFTPRGQSQSYNLRSCFRITRDYFSGLEMSLSFYPVRLLNISMGGAAFSHGHSFQLQARMIISPTLTIDEQSYRLEAEIKRVYWPDDHPCTPRLEWVSVAFTRLSGEARQALSKKIIDLQRAARARALGG